MINLIKEDISMVMKNDPAAKRLSEVLFTSPGLHAVMAYRISHHLYKKRFVFTAKLMSYFARIWTGVEIHPAAQIGRGLFIDHGMGIVIGETVIIKDYVTLFQGVTLGGRGHANVSTKRHPTVESNAWISAGAKVIGNITIGENSKVGAGAVVLKDVPPNCTVVGIPAQIVKRSNLVSLIEESRSEKSASI